MEFDKSIEPILVENNKRFVLFPIEHQDIYDLYKKSLSLFWTVEEIDFSKDRDDFIKLNENERWFIENILAFFAASDGIVNENLVLNFYTEIQIPEARQLYSTQILIEAIHEETYSQMIENLIPNKERKLELFNALDNNEIVKKKANWAFKWFNRETKTFSERLLAFIVIEGVFFSASFAAIYWFKERGILPGLTKSNEFISRDESIHAMTGVLIYSKLKQKLSQEQITEIFMEAYEIEKEFMTKSLPVRLIGMNDVLMVQYIEYVIDYWISKLGYIKIFNTKNPFDFMNYISLENKTNFFEKRVSNYSHAKVGNTVKDNQISFDEDF